MNETTQLTVTRKELATIVAAVTFWRESKDVAAVNDMIGRLDFPDLLDAPETDLFLAQGASA